MHLPTVFCFYLIPYLGIENFAEVKKEVEGEIVVYRRQQNKPIKKQ